MFCYILRPGYRNGPFYMSVCVSLWVCESYVVHHLMGTGLHCTPLACVVHHWAALCTAELCGAHSQKKVKVHKGDLMWYITVWRHDAMWRHITTFWVKGLWSARCGRCLNAGAFQFFGIRLEALHFIECYALRDKFNIHYCLTWI